VRPDRKQAIESLCLKHGITICEKPGGALRFTAERIDLTVAGWAYVTEHDLRPQEVSIPAKRFKREVLQQQY